MEEKKTCMACDGIGKTGGFLGFGKKICAICGGVGTITVQAHLKPVHQEMAPPETSERIFKDGKEVCNHCGKQLVHRTVSGLDVNMMADFIMGIPSLGFRCPRCGKITCGSCGMKGAMKSGGLEPGGPFRCLACGDLIYHNKHSIEEPLMENDQAQMTNIHTPSELFETLRKRYPFYLFQYEYEDVSKFWACVPAEAFIAVVSSIQTNFNFYQEDYSSYLDFRILRILLTAKGETKPVYSDQIEFSGMWRFNHLRDATQYLDGIPARIDRFNPLYHSDGSLTLCAFKASGDPANNEAIWKNARKTNSSSVIETVRNLMKN